MTISKKKRRRYEQIKEGIRAILVSDWDPLDVHDTPVAWGEYDAYLFRIFEMIEDELPAPKIADYLEKLEVDSMGLAKCDLESAEKAALKLVTLKHF